MEDCYICYGKVAQGDFVFLSCSHKLCRTCLANLTKSVCPFCRTEIPKSNLVPLNINRKPRPRMPMIYQKMLPPIQARIGPRRSRSHGKRDNKTYDYLDYIEFENDKTITIFPN